MWLRGCFILFAIVAGCIVIGWTEAWAQTFIIDSLEVDGAWCPMAHCNRKGDSYQNIPPLLTLGAVQQITDSHVSPRAGPLLGCVTGESMGVCAYDSPEYPALVAYDYLDGSVKWTSPLEDLPEAEQRKVAGILLAKLGVNGNSVRHYVFTGNQAEFVAYEADGTRLWKRAARDITLAAPDGVGSPVSMTFNDAKELVTVTGKGWVIKLSPADGSTIDAYKMDTNVVVGGVIYRGTFISTNSPVVVGNVLYAVVEFSPDASTPLDPSRRPVHVVRIELNQPGVPGLESRIRPLIRPENASVPTPDRAAIGVNRPGGSPSALLASDGKVLIFADADWIVSGQKWPVIAAVEDNRGVLSGRWRSVLATPDENIRAAPAFYTPTRTLLVNTTQNLYVFRGVDTLVGNVSPPAPLSTRKLMNCAPKSKTATIMVGSPLGLAFNRGTNEIVAYTNFRVTPSPGSPTYGYLGAFALPAKGPNTGRGIWCAPLGMTNSGAPTPSQGALGQPALFQFDSGSGPTTGLIINTDSTGTFIFRSATTTTLEPADLSSLLRSTPTVASLEATGVRLRNSTVIWTDGCLGGVPGCIRSRNNPVTQYGNALLPIRGGEPTATFRFAGDDAFVVYGLTPPEITYYSFTMHQLRQFNRATGQYVDTVSSISLSINESNINTLGGPYNSYFALIVAADHAVANAVHRALHEAGVPEGAISHLLIPARFANVGTPFPDELTFLVRLTYRMTEEQRMVLDYIGEQPPNLQVVYFDGLGQPGDVVDADLRR